MRILLTARGRAARTTCSLISRTRFSVRRSSTTAASTANCCRGHFRTLSPLRQALGFLGALTSESTLQLLNSQPEHRRGLLFTAFPSIDHGLAGRTDLGGQLLLTEAKPQVYESRRVRPRHSQAAQGHGAASTAAIGAGYNPCLLPGLLFFLTRPCLRPCPALRSVHDMLDGLRQGLVSSWFPGVRANQERSAARLQAH